MLKLGITTVRGLERPRSWLGRQRHASMLLFASLAAGGRDRADAYDRLVERVKLPNGTWKQTAGRRLDDVDTLIGEALAASHPRGARVTVLDIGASTGVTSVRLCARLERRYRVRFIASDLYRDALAVSAVGWSVVLTASGEVLQYVIGPFVLPGQLDESPAYPVNRALKAIAARWLAPRARAIAAVHAAAAPEYLRRVAAGRYRLMRLPLFSYGCLERMRRDDRFRFAALDVLQPLAVRATVVRAMNVVTRDYFDEASAACALAHCIDAVAPGGLLAVGRSQGLAAGHTRATVYRRSGDRQLRPVARLNGGCELEALTLEVAMGGGRRQTAVARRQPEGETGTRGPTLECRPTTVVPVMILGIPFAPLDCEQAVAHIRALRAAGGTHHLVLANAHTVNCAWADVQYRAVLRRAALVLRDGVGVELAARLRRRPMRHNFVGTDFIPDLLARLAPPAVRVFLFGGRPGVAEMAGAVLARRCAGVKVAATAHGYEADGAVCERIRIARPDVLLVALGNPLQEHWIDRHASALGVPLAIGVGALFDFLAGRVPRAPAWMRRARAEWVFRLAVEPRRLWRRYLQGNAQFLWRVWRETRAAGRPRLDGPGVQHDERASR